MSEQSAGGDGVGQFAADLLDPYEKLINVEIVGREVDDQKALDMDVARHGVPFGQLTG